MEAQDPGEIAGSFRKLAANRDPSAGKAAGRLVPGGLALGGSRPGPGGQRPRRLRPRRLRRGRPRTGTPPPSEQRRGHVQSRRHVVHREGRAQERGGGGRVVQGLRRRRPLRWHGELGPVPAEWLRDRQGRGGRLLLDPEGGRRRARPTPWACWPRPICAAAAWPRTRGRRPAGCRRRWTPATAPPSPSSPTSTSAARA